MKTNQEWLEWRLGGIGGSDAPIVTETSPFCTPEKLLQIKARLRLPDAPNYPMRRGIRLEPVARALYEVETGLEMPKKLIEHDKIDFVRASLDGRNPNTGKVIEIKCPGRKDHATAVKGEIPEKYLYQCVHICLAAGVDSLDYVSYFGPDYGKPDLRIVPFKRNRRLEEKLLSKEYPFWERVLRERLPLVERSPMSSKQYPKSPFTAKEVCEILQFARNLGVRTIKLDGFEAAFDLSIPVTSSDSQPDENEDDEIPVCDTCGSEKTENSGGWYCKPCWWKRREDPSSVRHKSSIFRTRRNKE